MFPTGLKAAMLQEHGSWVLVYTDRPVSFYLGIDPTLKSSLLYTGDSWIDDLRAWDVTSGSETHVSALVNSHHDVMPLFSSAMLYPTEGTKLFEWFSSQMPQTATGPVWSAAGQQYIPGNHAVNASNLFMAVNGNPGMQATTAQNMADAIIVDIGMSGDINAKAFYGAVVGDNTLWQSSPLRAQNGPWTAGIRNIVNIYGEIGKLTGFFDAWAGSSAALAACTTPEYRLNAVFDANPTATLDDMIDEAGDVAIVEALTSSEDITTAEFGEVLITKASVSATDVTDALLGSSGDTFRLAEHHIYGSARLGVQNYDTLALANTQIPDVGNTFALNRKVPWYSFDFGDLIDSTKKEPYGTSGNTYTGNSNVERRLGKRYFELSDHVGGILATVLDRKTAKLPSAGGSLYDHWHADIASSSDMYPGGQQMTNRTTEWLWSRFGAQGSQKDDEMYGKGNFVDMGDRHLDVRIWKTPKPDEKATKYPHMSPYSFANNNPIVFVDPNGQENVIYLVVLPSASALFTPLAIEAIIARTNANFISLGLKTRMVSFDGGAQNFDITKIDAHDAVAVFGSKSTVREYVTTKLDEKFGNEITKDWPGPEKAENSGVNGRPITDDNIIVIDAEGIKTAAINMHLDDEQYFMTKTVALLATHAPGHLAGRNHVGEKTDDGKPKPTNTSSTIMGAGNFFARLFYDVPLQSVMDNKVPDFKKNQPGAVGQNHDYVEFMKVRFGDNAAKDNYQGKKIEY